MNKVYSLKFCSATNTIKVVSELTRRVCKGKGVRLSSYSGLFFATILIPWVSTASVTKGDINYQEYRDFSENKGKFQAGSVNIPIMNKNEKVIGHLNNAPMIDFSSANYGTAIATLINPQYITSVKHNGGYQTVSFGNGQNSYNLVDRNNQPGRDFHVPRLNKLVTEVAPSAITESGMVSGAYLDKNRYAAFYRAGSGLQQVRSESGATTDIAGAYSYLTGGTVGMPGSYDSGKMITSNTNGQLFDISKQGLLGTHSRPGDSGSPLFAYDKKLNKWVLVGVLSSGGEGGTNWAVIDANFIDKTIKEDTDAPVKYDSNRGPLSWTFDKTTGIGLLSQQKVGYEMHGKAGANLNAGKNLSFFGENGNVVLKNSVNQGAGSLTFYDSYTVTTDNNSTWIGGGIDVMEGSTLTWKVNGEKGDNLHKIGKGTLIINAAGINEGGLKVGDGSVVLNQQKDKNGNVQAFSSLNIASGRAVVILANDKQVNPDNITWGYKGGVLDINGNDLKFHRLNVADYGATITSNSKPATVTLDYYTSPESISINSWSYSRKGNAGSLYRYDNPYTGTVDYFILKTNNYGYFPLYQTSNSNWEYVGHSSKEAQKTVADRKNKDGYIFHGQFSGSVNVVNKAPSGVKGALVLDGSANTSGSFTQENGRLVIQGHPVIHAYNGKDISNKLAAIGDKSVLTQPTSFNQDDWERRNFTFSDIFLKNTEFGLGRNATLKTNITSDNSNIILGDKRVFIDKKDGDGTDFSLEEGISVPVKDEDKSIFEGNLIINNHSKLNIENIFFGSVESQDSIVNIASGDVFFKKSGSFINSTLTLKEGSHLTAQGLFSSGTIVKAENSSTLTLTGIDQGNNIYTPVVSQNEKFELGSNSKLESRDYSILYGDIGSSTNSLINLGTDSKSENKTNLLYSLLQGYNTALNGSIKAGNSTLNMKNALWNITDSSNVSNLSAVDSKVNFTPRASSSILTVKELNSINTNFIFNVVNNTSDKVLITKAASGENNSISVKVSAPLSHQKLHIPLIVAPQNTKKDLFTPATTLEGFSKVTPIIDVESNAGNTKWILNGFKTETDKSSENKATLLASGDYKNFITEVNNLYKRMGDLRDSGGEAGVWARFMNGTGSSEGGYSDNYTHLQIGFDKKSDLEKYNLFTGITLTHTKSNSVSNAFTGTTNSFGGGLYASALFDSGVYFDVVGKYIHHNNNYLANFAGLGRMNYTSHSWYAGLETGYRHYFTERSFIEPQAEIVYGSVSGKTFNWKDGNTDLKMTNKKYNPLIGRTGVEFGKTFSGNNWHATARAGANWQFDLLPTRETILQDMAGDKHVKGKRDGRMVFNVSIDTRIKSNVHIGLGFEKSAYGTYNTGGALNTNIRYTF
ncbi:TPA: autotransporter outer membrane beta-barrel domain-containing protein [Klebsiella oxytoca]|nr:autotransporter outer membrane beta-barrel domain-containing protein [Klebsiella oxytoca]